MSTVGPGNGQRVVLGETQIIMPSILEKVPQPPQKKIDDFWKKFTTKAPGKATTILPKNELAERLAKRSAAKDLAGGTSKTTTTSYEEAAAHCRAKVAQIVAECRRINQKYRDPHFDLDYDLRSGTRDCLESLSGWACDYESGSGSESDASSTSSSGDEGVFLNRQRRRQDGGGGEKKKKKKKREGGKSRRGEPGGDRGKRAGADDAADRNQNRGEWPGHEFAPESVKRVGDIFDDPKFYIDGPTANDVRQGRDGDCWLMAALCTLSNKPGLIERVCVAHDPDVGVYGFVFHRDGEWFSEIIDDKLYLIKPDYDQARMQSGWSSNLDRALWEDIDRPDSEEIYRRTFQSNSSALYFAQCENPNETWLPLLEKAYAKAHGDYACIEGGFTGEGIEDLTGGVTSELFTTDLLDKEYFWKEELMKVNKDFLFGCSTGLWGLGYGDRKGIYEGHAYSIMRAVEIDGQRLLLLKNPWGKGEWTGPWSDGSKEWTPEWLQKLDHRFGDDGAFWISYKDLLRKYQNFERTRLFGPEWKTTSMWTTLNVAWSVEYHHTKFTFTLDKPGPVVIVLSQLDTRYFAGLKGQYKFGLGFRVHKAGEEDYLVRTQTAFRMTRSCNVELDLEAGEYTVLIKLDATRYNSMLPAEEVVRRNAKIRREKLLRIGLAYDLAHSKARTVETAEEKAAREAYEKRQKEKHRQRVRNLVMKAKKKNHYFQCKGIKQEEKERAKLKEREKKKAERKEARRAAREKAAKQEEAEQTNEVKTEPAQEVEVTEPKVADEKPEKEAEGERASETSAKGEDGSPAEVKDGEDQIKVEATEPEGSADAGEKTPSASTSDTPAKEPVDVEQQPAAEVESKAVPVETVAVPIKEDTPDVTVKPTEIKVEVAEIQIAEEPRGAETPSETASSAGSNNQPPLNADIEEKIKKAIGVISGFKSELEGLLGEKQNDQDGKSQNEGGEGLNDESSDDEPEQHHAHPHHMHPRFRLGQRLPPPGFRRPPPSTAGPQSDDEDDDDVLSLPSLSDISDTELDYIVKRNDEEAKRIAQTLPQSSSSRPDSWNAVAVVGLRIYYKVAEEDKDAEGLVKLRVVRPNQYELSDDEDDADDEGVKVKVEVKEDEVDEAEVLDVDDSAKDATLKGEPESQ